MSPKSFGYIQGNLSKLLIPLDIFCFFFTVINTNRCLLENSPEYLPHPTLCNKYIQCQQGREIILHCPQWTVYSRNGSCTRDINESFCYNSLTTLKYFQTCFGDHFKFLQASRKGVHKPYIASQIKDIMEVS